MKNVLVVQFAGQAYGVHSSEKLELQSSGRVYRPPFSPAAMAGVTLVADKTVVLIDIAVVLGFEPTPRGGPGCILSPGAAERSETAFLVPGEPAGIDVDPSRIVSAPSVLRSPFITRFARLENGQILPLIDLDQIIARTERDVWEFEPISLAPMVSDPPPETEPTTRLLVIDGGFFAINAGKVEDRPCGLSQTLFLPNAPSVLAGVAACNDQVLPVLSLYPLIGLKAPAREFKTVPVDISGYRVLLAVDDDAGPMDPGDDAVRLLPELVQSTWRKRALLHDGDIVPLIEPEGILHSPAGTTVDPESAEDDAENDRGLSAAKEIQEFELAGYRYALPADQVAGEVTVGSWRELPDGPGIAPAVSPHEGDIWPLLDLCPYFGTRKRLRSGMTALAIKKGRFKALLLVDKILPRRPLADLEQRELPFALPHRIVYGCYLDESNVSLILNVQAMARHFDPSLVKDLLAHLPGLALDDAPSSVHDGDAASGLPVEEEEPPVDEEEPPVDEEEPPVDEEKPPVDEEEPPVDEEEPPVAEEEPPVAEEEPPVAEEEPPVDEEEPPVDEEEPPVDEEEPPVDEEEPPVDEEEPPVDEEELSFVKDFPPFVDVSVDYASGIQAGGEPDVYPAVHSPRVGRMQEPPDQAASPLSLPSSTRPRALRGAAIVLVVAAIALCVVTFGPWSVSLPQLSEEMGEPSKVGNTVTGGEASSETPKGKAAVEAGKAASPVSVQSKNRPLSTPSQTANTLPRQPVSRSPATESTWSPTGKEETAGENSGVYTVREGDSLWLISQRLHGTPWLYRHIAEENRIEDPDLIYPGQRVEIRK